MCLSSVMVLGKVRVMVSLLQGVAELALVQMALDEQESTSAPHSKVPEAAVFEFVAALWRAEVGEPTTRGARWVRARGMRQRRPVIVRWQ